MPVSRTRTRRYVALCDVADCDWSTGPLSLRIAVSERLRHHLRVDHGLNRTERDTMKTPGKELPKDEGLDRLSAYNGSLIVIQKGWDYDPAYSTAFGPRECVQADVWVYDTAIKAWRNLAGEPGTRTPIFFKTVIRQLADAGDDEDFGGLLMQGVPGRKNEREWAIVPPNPAQVKLLDKWEPNF